MNKLIKTVKMDVILKEKYNLIDLLTTMKDIRNPSTGCVWSIKQDFASLRKHTLEEAYEVVDAINSSDMGELKGELADLLYQVVFYAELAEEQGDFDFSDIIDHLTQKLIRRHGHVFSEIKLQSEAEINDHWQATKQAERNNSQSEQGNNSVLDNIPQALPALIRAKKIQQRAASVNFDFPTLEPVIGKVYEEMDEVLHEVKQEPVAMDKLEDELGDLLFSVVNLSRHLKIEPEQALKRANEKFEKRFKQVEVLSLQNGKELSCCSGSEMEDLWVKVKENYEI